MPSRLLIQLDAAIDAAKDPVERDRLRAERAGVLARHGNIGQARRIVNELRNKPAAVDDAELAAWLSLAEGMAEHFETLSPRARPRFLRAYALAKASQQTQLQALAAAWLAAVEWNDSQPRAALEHVVEALALADEGAHATRARASLVAADACVHAGRHDAAQQWFERARDEANADGDTSMISALLYNRAALRVNLLHLDDSFGLADDASAARALLEAESSGHFDTGVGTASLKDINPIVRAQALVVQRRFAEALAAYERHLVAVTRQGFVSSEPRLRADVALCHMQACAADEALAEARQVLALLDGGAVQADDRAAALARVAQVFRLAQLEEDASACQARADEALAEFRAQQAQLAALLDETIAKPGAGAQP